jgi:CheY-like chemotaxis protein
MSNAIKFTAKGFVEMVVERAPGGPDDMILRFAVRDTGIGISPKAQKRLFKPFTQADSSMTRKYGGTGLGLAISHRIVDHLGGKIALESSPGEGSTFYFVLPFETAKAPSEEECTGTPPLAVASRSGEVPKLLVAEDEPINRLVVVRLLEDLGLEVRAVATGREALAALAEESFDLVLMDCQMPELDGYETTTQIRRQERADSHLPVIAMTAHAMSGDREKCLAVGMDDYISKPFREEDLLLLLEKWLGFANTSVPNLPVEQEPAEGSALDSRAIATLSAIGGSKDVLGSAIDLFLTRAPKKLEEMHQSLASRDFKALARQAHSQVGTAGLLGAMDFAYACSSLESCILEGDHSSTPSLLSAAEAEFDRAATQLRKIIENRKQPNSTL